MNKWFKVVISAVVIVFVVGIWYFAGPTEAEPQLSREEQLLARLSEAEKDAYHKVKANWRDLDQNRSVTSDQAKTDIKARILGNSLCMSGIDFYKASEIYEIAEPVNVPFLDRKLRLDHFQIESEELKRRFQNSARRWSETLTMTLENGTNINTCQLPNRLINMQDSYQIAREIELMALNPYLNNYEVDSLRPEAVRKVWHKVFSDEAAKYHQGLPANPAILYEALNQYNFTPKDLGLTESDMGRLITTEPFVAK